MAALSKPSTGATKGMASAPTAAKSRCAPYERPRSSSSMDSFSASHELAALEGRLNLKLVPGAKPVATPSRGSATTPSVVPRKKTPTPPGAVVKTECGATGLPPPCSSFTPVKSPEQKKCKAAAAPSDPTQEGLKRSLCTDMDAVAAADGSTPTESTQLDESIGKAVQPEGEHTSPPEMPASAPNPEPRVRANSDGPDDRPGLRNLETQTTIPLGHVESADIDGALEMKYNQPLFKCLFGTSSDSEVDIEQLLLPTYHWLDTRVDRGDIDQIDPGLRRACAHAVVLKDLSTVKDSLVKEKEQERALALAKINTAADAMITQQREKVQNMGSANVDESPLFKVNKENIMVWKNHKIQLLDKAFQCVMDESATAEQNLRQHVLSMIESAYATWSEHIYSEPAVGVDPELFGELEAIMESSPKASATPTQDLGNQRLDDNEEVLTGGGLEETPSKFATPRHVIAQKTLLMRKDTTQLEASAPPRVTREHTETEEVTTYLGPGGRTETQDEHDRRLALNAKMRFHRSLQSNRCPPAVLEKAKGKRHNRQLIGELFESWLSAGEDWLRSSIHCNATRSMAQRRKGKYIMMEYRTLKSRFGNALAKQMLQEKKQQEESKDPSDPLTYWMKHPDVAQEDFEMVRIFDSMVYEDEVSDDLSMGISASGALDGTQTRQAMQIAVGNDIDRFQAVGLGMQPGLTSNAGGAPPPTEKPKKVTPLSKQVTNKIASSSTKLTELMAWEAKVSDNQTLSTTLLSGFKSELGARRDAITAAKTALEGSYAKTLGKSDKEIQDDPELFQTLSKHLANVEAAFTSFNGTIKSIKLAIDPPPKKEPKAKAKAKAAA